MTPKKQIIYGKAIIMASVSIGFGSLLSYLFSWYFNFPMDGLWAVVLSFLFCGSIYTGLVINDLSKFKKVKVKEKK